MLKPDSDSLGPVIVKEMRQELRLKSFTILFLLPQVSMMFAVLLQLLETDSPRQASGLANSVFWATICIPLFILIPRRGFFSFQKELEAKSLELVLMTRLSAWKLIAGKWAALALQCMLFLCAVSPYIVLRYFLGDTNPLATCELIFVFFIGSLLFTALGISGSAGGGRRRQLVSPIFVMIVLAYPLIAILERSSRLSGRGLVGWPDMLMLAVLAPLGILLSLEVGIAHIAPALENYAPRKRLLSLLSIGVVGLFAMWDRVNPALLAFMVCIIIVPVCLSSMFEEIYPLLMRGIRKRIRLMDWLRFPGWPGGVAFCMCASGLILVLFTGMGLLKFNHLFQNLIFLWAGLIQPLAILYIVAPPQWRTMASYITLQAFLFICSTVFYAYRAYGIFALLPLPVLFETTANTARDRVPVSLTYCVSALCFVALGIQYYSLKKEIWRRRAALATNKEA